MRRLLAALLALLLAREAGAQEGTVVRFPAPQGERAVLSIGAATDLVALEPLVRDFQALAPEVTVAVREYVTNDLFAAAERACADGRAEADILISSGVDQLVKLVNDGCALTHRSPETARVPAWAQWRNEIFGFTYEPAVIVYNRALVPPEDVPRTRTELIDLLRAKPEVYEGRIGSYDIVQSGIGYLFAFYDARETAIYGRLIEAFGRARLRTKCCTAFIIDDIASGELAIGYNMLGSYAVGALRRGAPIGIVVPRDRALVLSRAAMIPRQAANASAAQRFLDYLLSERGQRTGRRASFFFGSGESAPEGVDGPAFFTSSGTLRPIPVGPELLAVQDRAKRERFLEEWRRSVTPLKK